AALEASGEEYRMLILPDHPTPLAVRTHVSEPVPYVLFDSSRAGEEREQLFTEESGRAAGNFYASGPELLQHYLRK
ncbi:MAG: phosphoglycerate mutase, partial [Spirochaetota bacterium]